MEAGAVGDITVISTGAGDDGMEVEEGGDTADRRGDDAEAGVRMGSDDVSVEGGVQWVTVPWAALNFNAAPDSNVLDMGSASHPSPNSGKQANQRFLAQPPELGLGGWQGSPGPFDAGHDSQVTVTLTGAGADDMAVEAVGITEADPWVAGSARLAPVSTNAGSFAQPPGLGLGANKAHSGQGDKSCAAVHGTRITVTLTSAGDDGMEVEEVGDTADRRGEDAEAGARMDSDDVGGEGGVPWVTVRCEPMQSHGNIVAAPGKKKRQSKSAKRPGGPQGGGYNKARSTAALHVTQRNDIHLTFQQPP